MVYVTDIPSELLTADSKDDFIKWLYTIPSTWLIKKELAVKWQQFTGIKFTKVDYDNAGISGPEKSNLKE